MLIGCAKVVMMQTRSNIGHYIWAVSDILCFISFICTAPCSDKTSRSLSTADELSVGAFELQDPRLPG